MTAPSPTVFVVDDYAPLRRSISRLLRAAGFAVAAFASADEFLAQFDPQTMGCLVLDVAMPALNGLELQHILEKAGSLLPIIFLTGTADIPKSVEAMKHGASDFLTKPVNDEDLLAAVRVAIEKNRCRSTSSRPNCPKSERAWPRLHRVSGKCSNMSSLVN